MRAVVLQGRGGTEVLQLQDVEEPQVGPGTVRVRIRAAGLNRADVLQRMGRYGAPGPAPEIPGLEFAGEVDRCGEGANAFVEGDRVMGLAVNGAAHSQRIVVPERALLRVPEGMELVDAGAVMEAGITAHDALFTLGNLRPGRWVLIHAVGSGVGLAALQLAKAAGARVIGTSRHESKLARARAQGLNVGLVPDADGRFAPAVLEATGGAGVDLVLDFLGGPALSENVVCLAPQGRFVGIGLLQGTRGELDLATVLQKRLTLIGTVLKGRPLEEKLAAVQAFGRDVLPLLAQGRCRPLVDRVYPLQAVQAAHAQMEADETFGKLVLTP